MEINTSIKEAVVINTMDPEVEAIDNLISDLKAMKFAMSKVKRLSGVLSSQSEDLKNEIKELSTRLNVEIKRELEAAEATREKKHEELLSSIDEEELSKIQLNLILGITE